MVSAGAVLGGRYKLDERIAGGGMGDVWRGTDEVLGRTVAVKILLPALLEEPGFAERFRGEARTMATINHPGVVDVYDYGSDANVGAYLVMEFVEGDALSRTLSRVGRLTPARTMALVAQAADALQAAHDKGIVHRDVKPGNLLVRPNGTLVLTDFGIARSAAAAQLTQPGSVLGTASYISPEQASGGTATPLSDVYALGVVAYQCLAGQRPFEGDNPLEIAMKHVREQAPPLPPDIPQVVRGVVERAMAKDPAHRFPSAAALGQTSRKAAGSLPGGAGVAGAGAAGALVPPVPVSPTSPASGSPGATQAGMLPGVAPRSPAVPGGTRVMTGPIAAGPISPGPVAPGPVAPGGYNRGAASVPAPAVRRTDTGYYTPPVFASEPTTGAPGGRNNKLLIGALAGVVVVLLGLGIGAWALLGNHGGGGSPTNGATPTQQGGGQLVDLQCDQLVFRQANYVEDRLRQNGFKTQRVEKSGGKRNQVTKVDPCQAPAGATITITVSTGNGGGDNGGGNSPAPECNLPGLNNPLCPSDNSGSGGGGGNGGNDSPGTGGGGGLPSVAPPTEVPTGG
jgi:eukaryotic-like serine/threonine-protein kinase